MNAEVNKEFIFNYLSGKSTALQKQLLDEWVKNPANEELFYQWLVEYEYRQPQYLADVQEATERFFAYADQAGEHFNSEPLPEAGFPVRSRLWSWLVAASVAILLVGSGALFKDHLTYQTYRSAYGETKTLILSDSTRVVLNANSSLRVPRFGFGSETREVFLSGEANFDVSHQSDNQKFIVRTDKEFEVVVLGTEFTIYARAARSKVILNKGKVQLNYREGKSRKQLMMKPGDLVTLDSSNHIRQEVTAQPEQYAAWKEHRFVFDDTTLAEFAEIMHENYGIRVLIEDKNLAQRTLVGSFRAESPDELLEIICRIFNLKMVRNGEVVKLVE
ncbi:FecR family protein [Persicitalea jodogahamensis]|uniref:Iron dicitrate transporter FecR n=1 Tax=Persicitalea jodogahamensis TaxID=402147 RepID=A0A8J3D8L1_9BACT|nr:FecR domain-containing protein [Persicitalea jodogahamensis]GHB88196.1 iron dicitrate transporter FecR [Persicitalea jodogahamensis]